MVVKIKDIPKDERPCERLILNGPEALSNEELLAIIIKVGSKDESAKELATKILSSFKNIRSLNEVNYRFLSNFKGIGMSKACNILATIELGKRLNRKIDKIKNVKLNSSDLVYNFYKDRLGDKKQEYFYCIYLDTSKRIISDKLLFIGTVNYSVVHPREVFKEAYLTGASAIICVHNHPSGNPIPSSQDYEVTKNLISAGKIFGIPIIDHIVVCKTNYYSFLENNDINF